MTASGKTAFTLIELLVVITIIVVLLSLLAPGMQKAIYMAEMATCATNLHGIGVGANTYGAEHRRSYPYRPNIAERDDAIANRIHRPTDVPGVGTPWDDRPVLRNYMSINGLLNDPMTGKVDLEDTSLEALTSWVLSSYHLWFGWQYKGERGMKKLGDRFGYTVSAAQSHRFNLLAGDRDVMIRSSNPQQNHGSHPDADGVLLQREFQNEMHVGNVIWATWITNQTVHRGPIDRNFVYADGSVGRLDKLVINPDGSSDARLVDVPEFKSPEGSSLNSYPLDAVSLPRP